MSLVIKQGPAVGCRDGCQTGIATDRAVAARRGTLAEAEDIAAQLIREESGGLQA